MRSSRGLRLKPNPLSLARPPVCRQKFTFSYTFGRCYSGHGRLELTKFRNPKLVEREPAVAPPNAAGLRSVMFTVESVDDTVTRLRTDGGAELIGEVARYEDKYKLGRFEQSSSRKQAEICTHLKLSGTSYRIDET